MPRANGEVACISGWSATAPTGGRSSRQREQSFGDDLREAEDFALKVEHDKRAHVFVDPKAGQVLFRDAAETWLDQHLGADSSIATYRSVLRAHIDPAIGGKPIGAIRREDIKALIAGMHRKGLSASRIGCAHLVISAVLAEAVRDKKLAESPCTGIQLPGVVTAADFILPAHAQVEAVAVGLPPGLGRHRVADARLRAADRRGPRGQPPLPDQPRQGPARQGAGQPGRATAPAEIPQGGGVPRHPAAPVRHRSDRQARRRARHHTPTGTCSRAASTSSSSAAATRRTSAAPPPGQGCRRSSSRTHCATSTPRPHLAEGIPITEVSRWLGHKSIEVTHQIYGHLVPVPSTAPAPSSTLLTVRARSGSGARGFVLWSRRLRH